MAGDVIGADATLTGTRGAYNTFDIWNRQGGLFSFATSPDVDSYAVSNVTLFSNGNGTVLNNYTLGTVSRTSIQITPRPITATAMGTVTITYGDEMVRGAAAGQTSTDIFPNAVTYDNLVRATDGSRCNPPCSRSPPIRMPAPMNGRWTAPSG